MVTVRVGEPSGGFEALLPEAGVLGVVLELGIRGGFEDTGVFALDGLLRGMISLPLPFTSIITSSSESPNVIDCLYGTGGSSSVPDDTFLLLRSCCLRPSSSASRKISGNTSFECLKRSRSLSSSAFLGSSFGSDCWRRATVRLKGSALRFGGSATATFVVIVGKSSLARK
ncbi:hypothetical protein VTI74DRAFT_2313 [Chaetomium olivicolor]